MDAAEKNAVLFRAELPVTYGKKAPNDRSTYFAYSVDFDKGSIGFRGKIYDGVLLNLNADIDEVYLKDAADGSWFLMNKNLVDSFSMGNRFFIHHKQNDAGLKNGYYQVLYAGKHGLYKKIRKSFSQKITSGVRVLQGFVLSEEYYVWAGRWIPVNTKSDLKRVFKERKNAIDQLIRTKSLNFKEAKEQTLIDVLTFIDEQ